MKKLAILLVSALLMLACNNNSSSNDQNNDDQAETKTESTSKASCDKFLKDYEEWVDEVIEVYKKVKENPMDLANTTKAMEASQKMADYAQKWTGLYDCANSKKYAKKMEALEKKVEKAMSDE